jgi:type IV fimbrial biogenesis protein FimT
MTCAVPVHCTGLTLIELLMATAVLALLVVFAPGAYADWMAAQQVANEAHLLAETLQLARSEAIKHGYRVNVCKSADGQHCDAHAAWQSGWIVYADENRSGDVDEEESVIRRERAAPEGVGISANHPVADYVSYTPLGHARMLNGALQMGTFVVCKRGQQAIHVVLANGGRARIEKTRDPCA